VVVVVVGQLILMTRSVLVLVSHHLNNWDGSVGFWLAFVVLVGRRHSLVLVPYPR